MLDGMLVSFLGRTNMKVARKDRVGWGQNCPQNNAAGNRHSCKPPRSSGHGKYCHRHRYQDQPHCWCHAPEGKFRVDPQTRAEQRDNHSKLTDGFPKDRLCQWIKRRRHCRKEQKGDRARQQDQGGCGGLPSREKAWQPIGIYHAGANRQEQNMVTAEIKVLCHRRSP